VKDIEDWMMGLQINTAAGLAFDRRRRREAVRHAADPSTKDGTRLERKCLNTGMCSCHNFNLVKC